MTGLSLVAILLTFSLLYVSTFVFKKSMILKLTIVTYLFLISSGVYFSFETYKGWPSKDKLDHGYLVFSMVVEPSKDDPGAIYYWAMPEEKDMNFIQRFLTYKFELMTAPRAYYLPYSKKAAQEFADANEKLKQGYVVEIGGKQTDQKGGDGGKQKSDGGENSNPDGEQEDYNVPHLTIISPDEIFRKDAQ